MREVTEAYDREKLRPKAGWRRGGPVKHHNQPCALTFSSRVGEFDNAEAKRVSRCPIASTGTATMTPMNFSGCGVRACEEVVAGLRQALQNDPGQIKYHYQLGLCTSGLCRQHSMVCPDAALEHLRRAASAMRGKGDPAQRAGVLTLLGITYTRAAMLPLTARMLAAIRCYQDAADLYAAARQFEPWARMQFNLGNAWCELQEAEFPGKWEQAIAHYKQALLYRRRDVNPQAYAVTLENLGSAYRARTQGNKTENVVEAIRCYRRALRICREDVAPASWAALQNNLGNALLSLPAEFWPASSRAPAAIRHFDFALRIRTREKNLYDYGVTQLNRAQAYFQLGLDGSGGDLMEAAEGFHDALEAFVASGHAAEAKIARRGLELIGQAATWVPLHNGPIPAAGGPLRRCE